MSGKSQALRLRRLIGDRLGPYKGREAAVWSRDDEKNLLIALSQVLRQVQLWTRELDCSSDSEVDAKTAANDEALDGIDLHSEESQYLTDIICDLIVLLNAENQHVQHVTGNLLLEISGFLSESESNWPLFIYLLFVCAEFSLSNILSQSSAQGYEGSRCSLHIYILVLKPRLQNVSWFAVVQVTRVLRYIWKNLKHVDDDEPVKAYLDSLNYFLSEIPLQSFDEIYAGQNEDRRENHLSDASPLEHSQQPQHVFLGYLVQLLCSVSEQALSMEVQSGSLDRHPALSTIVDLVPKLFHWCLSDQDGQAKARLLMYFRHKLLILMMRLSTPNDFQYSNFASWLQLLHCYFQEFLWNPTAQVETLGINSLEGSPFASFVPDEKMRVLNIPHIQRQATYLFLRCSLGLVRLKGEIGQECNCSPQKIGLNLVMDCCHHNKGLMELNQWLKRNVATENLSNGEICLGKCLSFASSFLQLYMLEDDLLFKVLLQMLNIPLNGARKVHEGGQFPNMEEDLLFHASNVFSPITIFHIFLAEIHYDHQVLLDYLISKDTGLSCAQYLLRCLRIVCDKFQQFLEFQVNNVKEEPPPKKRKSLTLDTTVLADSTSSPSLEKNTEGDHRYRLKIRGQPFEEAKWCLFSLKDSLESLNQKNLFPYNPKALLKRLMEFQEFCYKQ